MTREQYSNTVIAQVAEMLQQYSWYKGVCTDKVIDHYPDVEAGVRAVHDDTWFWDGPWFSIHTT